MDRKSSAFRSAILSIFLPASAFAQGSESESSTMMYVVILLALAAAAGAVLYFFRDKIFKKDISSDNGGLKLTQSYSRGNARAVQRENEVAQRPKPVSREVLGQSAVGGVRPITSKDSSVTKRRPEPNRRGKPSDYKFEQFPVSKFMGLSTPADYPPLESSDEEDMYAAIEQTQDEFEEDSAVRELALRILARFRTRESVDALSQVALYDLSAQLRSKALTILTEFDHESVFEAVVLAGADPSKEVRAAAARGLFRLSFDRGDAWARIALCEDEARRRQAARASIEAGWVDGSLDRLLNWDEKTAYEAYSLVTLLVRAGETTRIFEAITLNQEDNVKLALLHVIERECTAEMMPNLAALLEVGSLPKPVAAKVQSIIEQFANVPFKIS